MLRPRVRHILSQCALGVLVLAAPGFLWSEQPALAPAPARAEAPRDTDARSDGPAEAAQEPPPPPLPPMPTDEIRCEVPDVPIEVDPRCEEGAAYPFCRSELPPPRVAEHVYSIWRNTAREHRSARPALVALILATAAEYARRYPGETLAVGDLDAPGPRHETHDNGVDVDLYLPGMMAVENVSRDEWLENYTDLDPFQKRMVRSRVETLARILATCSNGRLRIFYNDDEVLSRFRRWYDSAGYEPSELGPPMRAHNDLHRFHFHVTIPEDLEMPGTRDEG